MNKLKIKLQALWMVLSHKEYIVLCIKERSYSTTDGDRRIVGSIFRTNKNSCDDILTLGCGIVRAGRKGIHHSDINGKCMCCGIDVNKLFEPVGTVLSCGMGKVKFNPYPIKNDMGYDERSNICLFDGKKWIIYE